MADKRLNDYVEKQKAAGYSDDKIREVLMSEGWPEKDINDALSDFRKTEKAPAKSAPAKPSGGPVKAAGAAGGAGTGGRHVPIKLIAGIMVIIVVVAVVISVMLFGLDFLSGMGRPAQCGNAVCDAGEDSANCPADCPAAQCGNAVCDPGEDYTSCPSDCPAPPALQTRVVVSPPTQTVSSGSEVTVNVMVYNSTDMFGFQFNLNYDENVLEFSEATEGTFLNENGAADTFWMAPSVSSGLITNVVVARKGQIGGVDGDGVMAVIKFNAIAAGTSPLTLSGVQLSNSQVKAITFTTTNGEVVVQ